MRFLIIVKATAESEAGTLPEQSLMARMAAFHEELSRAGVLLDASTLRPSIEGWRIRHHGASHTVIAGPFADDGKLMAGYTLIQARSREEALEWARRFPSPCGEGLSSEIEVRPLYALDELAP
ncbi:MAG: YciI family protein [Azoarcus sp.]|nr:YciI family protein [Azoarcus sp.]